MPDCPVIIGDPAVGIAGLAFDQFTTFASQAFGGAQTAIADFTRFELKPLAFNFQFADQGNIGDYHFPTKPITPSIIYKDVGEPGPPPDSRVDKPVLDTAPEFNVPTPVIDSVPPPNPQLPASPGDAPPIDAITLPADPVIPDQPELLAIDIPPPVTLPPFLGQRPNITFAPPENNFSFTPQEYTSALLDKTTATISRMQDGGTGLPAAVAAALRARAFAANDIAETRAAQAAREEFGQLGWETPNGILKRDLAEVRQNNQNQRNSLSRDIFIQDQTVAIENLRFAVTQGVSLESQKYSAHVQLMQVGLDAAKTAVSIGIDLFNAQVALFNAQEQAFATDATVWREQVQAQIEFYRSELEGQRLRGELNQQQVAMYGEFVRAVTTVFTSQIEGKRALSEINRTRIEAFRAQVESYGEGVRAYGAVWDAYKARIDAQGSKARITEALTNAYAARIQAFGKVQDVKIASSNLQIAEKDLDIRAWRGGLDKYIAKTQSERDRIAALVSVQAAAVELYKADADIQKVASDVRARNLQLLIAQEQARVDTGLKNSQLQSDQLLKLYEMQIEIKKLIATVESQLAASAMSAIGCHTSVSSSRSESQSCGIETQILASE